MDIAERAANRAVGFFGKSIAAGHRWLIRRRQVAAWLRRGVFGALPLPADSVEIDSSARQADQITDPNWLRLGSVEQRGGYRGGSPPRRFRIMGSAAAGAADLSGGVGPVE